MTIRGTYREFLARNGVKVGKHEARVLQKYPDAMPFVGMMGWGIAGSVLSMGHKTMLAAWKAA